MKRRLGTILLALLCAASSPVWAADLWSAPVQTQQWSQPEYTEPWSEVEYVESWGEAGSVEPPVPGEAQGEIDPMLLDFESLYGIWLIWTPSAPLGGGHVQQGKDQGMVAINPDGTYVLLHQAWDPDPVEGSWRLSYPGEINGEAVQAIVLLDGPTGTHWAVAPDPSGKVRLLWAMQWADGSALWFFDAELYR